MLYDFIVGPIVLGLLMVGWIGLQSWVRRRSPLARADTDVLQGRFGCCGTCFEFETCLLDRTESIADTDVLEVDLVDEVAL